MENLKHKVIIEIKKGNILSIHASGDTDVFIISDSLLAKLEPDTIFEIGKGNELFKKKEAKFLKQHGV